MDIFLENNSFRFQAYYAVEPDAKSFEDLERSIELLDCPCKRGINPVNKALYNTTGSELDFYSLHSPGSFVNTIGKDKVSTITIDDMLDGSPASFVKMNIEGCEMAALQGAEKTIQEYAPTMAIMGYHKTSDLWEIPFFIMGKYPDYHLFLRSHMNHMSFRYYAVPNWRCI